MSLYRTGTAAMDAQGVITGTGTKWREPLSLIRTGATIVFLTSPLKLAVISDIVSDTEMKAIQTDGEPVENGNYVILLNDSLTVDGMAQDVAETLRYYQSKETVIEEAIEFFKNFDLKTLQDLVARAEASAQKTDADRAATEQLKNDTQTIKNAAVTETQQIKDSAVTETNQIKADTDAIKNQTQQIKDSAVTEITGIKNEALDARDEAENAQFAAEQSKVGADNAKAGAETARDEARQWAQQVNPENLLHKDQNLADVPDKEQAKVNFGLDRIKQNDDSSRLYDPANRNNIVLMDTGVWGVYDDVNKSFVPLGIAQGGTGGKTPEEGANNIGVGPDSYPFFSGVNISTTGYAILGVQNTSRAATDVGARVSLEASPFANSRGSIIQKNNKNTPENQIESILPSTSGVLAVQGTSGREYKKDIKDADTIEALQRIMSLRMVNFVYKDDNLARVRFGIIAEEAEEHAPQYVKHNQFPIHGSEIFDDEGNKIGEKYHDRPSIDVNPIVMDLLGCIQEQQKQIDELKATIAEMQVMFVQFAK